jgi:rubrerythrin
MVGGMELDVGIIEDIETLLKNLNGYELLSYAICNEECGVEIYEWLAERSEGPLASEFRYIAEEKRKHAYMMRELFERLYPGMKPLEMNAPPLDTLPLCEKIMEAKTVEDALGLALLSEALGRDIYRKLQGMTKDESVAGLFRELFAIKEDTYERLRGIYDRVTGEKG